MMKTNTWVYIKAVFQAILAWVVFQAFLLGYVAINEQHQYGDLLYFLNIGIVSGTFSCFFSARFGKSCFKKEYWDWTKSLGWTTSIILLLPALALLPLLYLLNILNIKEPFYESLIYLGAYVIVPVVYTRYGLYKKEQEEDQSVSQSPETV